MAITASLPRFGAWRVRIAVWARRYWRVSISLNDCVEDCVSRLPAIPALSAASGRRTVRPPSEAMPDGV